MLGKIWGYTMKNWENSFAASFMYQDLADCSIGAMPVVTELEHVADEHNQNEIKKKKLELDAANILRKASAFFFVAITLVTKFV